MLDQRQVLLDERVAGALPARVALRCALQLDEQLTGPLAVDREPGAARRDLGDLGRLGGVGAFGVGRLGRRVGC